MGERTWTSWRFDKDEFPLSFDVGLSDAEVLREILLDENGEPRDGVERRWDCYWPHPEPCNPKIPLEYRDYSHRHHRCDWVYVVPAEMLEAEMLAKPSGSVDAQTSSLMQRHMEHYRSCGCLDGSSTCCDPTCCQEADDG